MHYCGWMRPARTPGLGFPSLRTRTMVRKELLRARPKILQGMGKVSTSAIRPEGAASHEGK